MADVEDHDLSPWVLDDIDDSVTGEAEFPIAFEFSNQRISYGGVLGEAIDCLGNCLEITLVDLFELLVGRFREFDPIHREVL